MITSIRLINFKNFADETLKLGPFTVIVGANASGKSNIRDAFRFLHGIGRGYTLAEIIGGKIGVGGQLEWEAIRGAPNAIARLVPPISRPVSSFRCDLEAVFEGEFTRFSTTVGSTSIDLTSSRCSMKNSILVHRLDIIPTRTSNQRFG